MKKVGGKFYGEGSYGCAFSPSPDCTTPETSIDTLPADKSKVIAKVFLKKKNADQEWEIAKTMKRVDPKQKSFLYPVSSCMTTVAEIKKDRDAADCSYTTTNPDNHKLPILKMVKGGIHLDDMFKTYGVDTELLVSVTEHVLSGIRKLIKARMIHHDIKFNNILLDISELDTKVVDFGLMIPMDYAFDKNVNTMLESKYWLHPPEYFIATFINHMHPQQIATKTDARALVESIMRMLDIYFDSDTGITLKTNVMNVFGSYCEYEECFTKYMLNCVLRNRKGKESLNYMTKYANKIDIYSLGISLLYLSDYIDFANNGEKKRFYNLLKLLIHPDPRKRPSPRKAAQLLKYIA